MTVCTLAGDNVAAAARRFLGLVRRDSMAAPATSGAEMVSMLRSYAPSAASHEQVDFEEPEQFGGALTF